MLIIYIVEYLLVLLNIVELLYIKIVITKQHKCFVLEYLKLTHKKSNFLSVSIHS